MAKILNEEVIFTRTCKCCGGVWVPRKKDIKQCPRCKSLSWNKERQVKKNVGKT